MKRNPHFAQLPGAYIFPEIGKRKEAFLAQHPDASLISLGIGDTTEPLPEPIARAMVEYAGGLGQVEHYSGYGGALGWESLRQMILDRLYAERFGLDEITLSDGAKCDLGRLTILFGSDATVAVQDPAYPVYVDTSIITGHALTYLPCTPKNDFFPDLTGDYDLLFICSPNNPTGAAMTREQLTELVAYAHHKRAVIIYDAAYAPYIQDGAVPQTIYEIEGAEEVAIEVGSFSKLAGFTGVRLGWTVVPRQLRLYDGRTVLDDWHRLVTTFFNGPSNIAQAGGVACLQDEGWSGLQERIAFYLENVQILRKPLEEAGVGLYGGVHAPYLWAHFPNYTSWDLFDQLLQEAHLISTPGSGFGPSGEGFVRLSAFGHREQINEAAQRLASVLATLIA